MPDSCNITHMNIDQNLAVEVVGLTKIFKVGSQNVTVLKDINFTVKSGNFDIIIGPSGSGKSTLLHSILGLEIPSKGIIKLLGKDLYSNINEDDRSDFRKKHVGMVYQQPHWVKSINVLANVALPLMLLGDEKDSRFDKAMEMLKMLHMENWAHHHPSELSSGQQQKVALSRALITNPELIVADEPTGNLDIDSGKELLEILRGLSKNLKKTVLMVTHDLMSLKYADNAVKVVDGKIDKEITKKEILEKYREITF